MNEARQTKVIAIENENEVGAPNRISKIVAEKGINIIGVTGEVRDGRAVIRLMTDDNLRARVRPA